MNNNQFLIIIIICILVIYFIYNFTNDEHFWGGWMPTLYNGQPIINYGRYGVNAATEDPQFLIDINALQLNN